MRRPLLVAVLAVSAVAVACGGGDEGGDIQPPIANSPIPTLTPVPTPAPICEPPPLAAPSGLPDDIALPPDLVIESIQTSPTLIIRGVSTPPDVGVPPWQVVGDAMRDNMVLLGWTLRPQPSDGRGYTFQKADGRSGVFFARDFPGCDGRARFDIEFRWITGQAPP